MKPKIMSDQTAAGTRRTPRWLIVALLTLLYPLMLPFDSLAANNLLPRKIKIEVGDVLNYKITETFFYANDTVKSSSWFTFKVIGKNDTLYSMIAIPIKKIQSTKNSYSDSRFPENSDFMSYMVQENYKEIPFYLSESGIVQPIIIPNSTVQQLIRKQYPNDLFGASLMMDNLETLQQTMRTDFQQFFVGWNSIKNGRTTSRLENNITYSNILDLSPGKDFSKFVTESETLPADTINGLIDPSSSKGNSRVSIDPGSSLITEMEGSTTLKWYKIKNPKFEINNKLKSFSVGIQRFIPDNDSTVTITGTLDKNCNPQTFNCYIITNYIGRGEEFVVTKDLEPGKSFSLDIPLKWPIATNLSIGKFGTFSSFLLEPGDSIHVTITPNGVEYSGPDALKSKMALAMRNNRLNIETSWTEEQAKQQADSWIATEQKKIEPFKDQISWWAYNEIRCDIYYSAMIRLSSYYINKNYHNFTPQSFETLFGSVKWRDYQSFSSMDMMRFISDYLNIKSVIIAGLKEYHPTSETGKYHLAKLIFNNKIEYHARSQCVYEALKRKDLEEGRVLFNDYEKTYKGTGFYPFLKSKLENRAELGEGATAPEFIATDVNGKKITLGKLKGKYVQLLFVDLKYEDDKQELAEYQKLKELSAKKFELITVFINENDSLTKAYIKENKPKGILISNPDWQLENLKKFNSEYTSPFYLVNPKGIIVFSGAGSPTEEFVQMIIEMINNDNYNQAEASVSKRTLYWVLLLSALTILVAFVVFVIITKSVKRRETFRRNQLELKLSAVRSQLNPHFLFNSMTSIQYLVNHNENEKANLFLSKFAQLMRKVLFQSEIERIPLKEELATIETYLELEALRHRFSYKINIEKGIDLYNTEIPVMLLQPFVENAVIHGISKLGEKGTIEIMVEKSGTHKLKISIIDNGSGYTNGNNANANSNGKGMQITRKRIDLMMAKYGHEIAFNVRNRKEIDASLTGTEVEITFETEA